jgi:hypothetical protein
MLENPHSQNRFTGMMGTTAPGIRPTKAGRFIVSICAICIIATTTPSYATGCERFGATYDQLTAAVSEDAMETIRFANTTPAPDPSAACKADKKVADLAGILLAFDSICFPDDPVASKQNLSRMVDDSAKSRAIKHCPY